jgi:endonuclease YncB( thermonuclease family)
VKSTIHVLFSLPYSPIPLLPYSLTLFVCCLLLLCLSFPCHAQQEEPEEETPQPSLSDIFTDECGDAPNSLDDYSMPSAFSNVEVVEVSSGNSIVVQLAANKTRKLVRLAGLSAPDVKTNEGKAAQKFLSDLVLGKRIFVFQYEATSADKMEGIVALAGTYKDVNLSMLKSGLVRYQESKLLSSYDNCVYKHIAEQPGNSHFGNYSRPANAGERPASPPCASGAGKRINPRFCSPRSG